MALPSARSSLGVDRRKISMRHGAQEKFTNASPYEAALRRR
jgi:hypothetical protein